MRVHETFLFLQFICSETDPNARALCRQEMFRGLSFMVNGKICGNISGENLMCRYDSELKLEIAERTGYLPMIMKGKEYKSYCYVEPASFKNKEVFDYWIKLCLDFNDRAKSYKKT